MAQKEQSCQKQITQFSTMNAPYWDEYMKGDFPYTSSKRKVRLALAAATAWTVK